MNAEQRLALATQTDLPFVLVRSDDLHQIVYPEAPAVGPCCRPGEELISDAAMLVAPRRSKPEPVAVRFCPFCGAELRIS